MKRFGLLLFYFLSFIYLEVLFKIIVVGKLFRIELINMVAFVLCFAFIMYLFTKLFNKKVNKIIFLISLFLICFWFAAQMVVKGFFDFYISFSILGLSDQVGCFASKALIEIAKRIVPIIFIFIPFILGIILRKKIDFSKNDFTYFFEVFILLECSFLIYQGTLLINKNEHNSSYELYHEVNNPSVNIEKAGVINTFAIDLHRLIWGFDEKLNLNPIVIDKEENPTEKEYEYNNLDIDFDSIINSTNDSTIKDMSSYFKNSGGTKQNEYTSFFEGKNLILFMAESFNEVAVRKDTTPTLYKLANSGFVFNNYYTPTIYSTIGGEFQELTGLYANFESLTRFRSGQNTYPMGIANVFKEKGYNTYAYHNNSYVFQNRDTYLKSLGFDNFEACYNGLEKKINCHVWPQSDLEMIDNTYLDYIDSDKPFMVFYASVSGHSGYSFIENAQARKHKEEIEKLNLGYSEGPLSYLAAQMELDRALESLINKLSEKGLLDNTVIALVGDHYPYELTVDEVNEIASYKKDSKIEINHSKFILWNNKMDTIKVDKVGSQMDVIPTLYNLFGIPYDSRLFMGSDILSTEMGLAIFENRSWVSDKGKYFASSGTYEGDEDAEYIKNMNTIVNNKINMSKFIIDKDYYKLVWNYKK